MLNHKISNNLYIQQRLCGGQRPVFSFSKIMKHKQNSRHQPQKQNKRSRLKDDSDSDDPAQNSKPSKAHKKTHSTQFSKLNHHNSTPLSWSCSFTKCFWPSELSDHVSDDLKNIRKGLGVLVKGAAIKCPPPITTLQDSKIPSSFMPILSKLNITTPSTIQMQSWPAILAGCNVLGIAPTGSGKTLAFSLPVIPHIQHQLPKLKIPKIPSPVCLVVVPTRELAIQVAAVIKKFKPSTGINCIPIYGGHDRDEQLESLRDCPNMHAIVATPGRLLDLVSAGSLSLERVTYLVIDEADRMLALGFEEQLTLIGSYIRPDRQTLLFTATFPGKLREMSTKWMRSGRSESGQNVQEESGDADTVIIRVNTVEFRSDDTERESVELASSAPTTAGPVQTAADNVSKTSNTTLDHAKEGMMLESDDLNVPTTASGDNSSSSSRATTGPGSTSLSLTLNPAIEQSVHVCASHKKPRLLINYVTKIREKEKNEKCRQGCPMLIFCSKIKTVSFVQNFLTKNGMLGVQQLHGQMPQQRREGVLADFKAGKVLTVVATDVAARGIHIKRLKYVVNYDFPASLEQYCHRVGRTGRSDGEKGYSYSLLTRNLAPLAEDLTRLLENCSQVIEPNLVKLVMDYKNGLVDVRAEEEANGDGSGVGGSDEIED